MFKGQSLKDIVQNSDVITYKRLAVSSADSSEYHLVSSNLLDTPLSQLSMILLSDLRNNTSSNTYYPLHMCSMTSEKH